jgi:hypothetical protein
MTFFINGGNPGGGNAYPGATVTTMVEALTLIRNSMLNATSGKGWVIGDVDNIEGASQFSIDGTDTSNNKLRMLFTGAANLKSGMASHAIYVQIRDLDSAGATISVELPYSPANTIAVPLEVGNTNKVFMAIETDSVVICIIPSTGFACSFHAGYIDRLNTSDRMALYVGHPVTYGGIPSSPSLAGADAVPGISYTRVGKLFESLAIWGSVAPSPATSTSRDSSPLLINTHDPMDMRLVEITNWELNSSTINIMRGVAKGSGNAYTTKPLLAPYYIIETGYKPNPQFSTTNYPSTVRLACRGYVRNIVRGMAYMGAGVQWQTDSGEVYMSTGAAGWQGMRIV